MRSPRETLKLSPAPSPSGSPPALQRPDCPPQRPSDPPPKARAQARQAGEQRTATGSPSRCHSRQESSALLKMALRSMRKTRGCWGFIRALHKAPEAAPAPQVTKAGPSPARFPSSYVLLVSPPSFPPFASLPPSSTPVSSGEYPAASLLTSSPLRLPFYLERGDVAGMRDDVTRPGWEGRTSARALGRPTFRYLCGLAVPS